jgi:LysR family transcriptional activator of glutamate synthase operon
MMSGSGEPMNIESFYSFLETSRQKSFSKASEKLNLSQPALSKQIRHLENELGVELFRRSAIGVELTDEGLLLQERILPILTELESLQNDLINLSRLSTFRLASLPSLAMHYLPQKITEMKQQGIQIEISVFPTSAEIMDLLQTGTVDAAVVQTSALIPKSFWYIELFCEPFYAVIPETHALYEKDEVTLSELADEALVVYPHKCDVRNKIVEAFDAENRVPIIGTEVSFGESIPGFVASGSGISILPEIMAKHIWLPSLKAIPITGTSLSRTISLVCPKPDFGKKLRRYFK